MEVENNKVKKGKESLDSMLRKKALKDVANYLEDKGIDINSVNDNDLEELVAGKVKDMKNNLKGFAAGGAFMYVLEGIL
ncbi:MAG: hypothetical protein HOI47_22585 [Candidatus Scalindua sp.]|jgi:hypothetical protein|nr:hypothetical protein [Candidatus Scalindua sp.]MBT6229442.1 hypothetical protein [Candidatus Scalindua sp.]